MGIIRKTVSLTGGAVGVPINFRSAKEEVKRELKHQKKRQKEFERQGLVDPEAVLGDMLRADQAAVQLGVADELERLAIQGEYNKWVQLFRLVNIGVTVPIST